MVKIFALVALVGLIAAGCGTGPHAFASEISPETQADISVRAIEAACAACGSEATMYVRNELFDIDTLVGDEQPMPQGLINAISGAYPTAVFVDRDEASALFDDDDGVIDDGVLVEVGPVHELGDEVVGLSIGMSTARDGGLRIIVQFQWDGSQWQHATSDDTGVTVTSAVS